MRNIYEISKDGSGGQGGGEVGVHKVIALLGCLWQMLWQPRWVRESMKDKNTRSLFMRRGEDFLLDNTLICLNPSLPCPPQVTLFYTAPTAIRALHAKVGQSARAYTQACHALAPQSRQEVTKHARA